MTVPGRCSWSAQDQGPEAGPPTTAAIRPGAQKARKPCASGSVQAQRTQRAVNLGLLSPQLPGPQSGAKME